MAEMERFEIAGFLDIFHYLLLIRVNLELFHPY